MTRTTVALAFAAAFAAASAPTLAQQKKTVLSLDTARKMTQACIDKATEMGWKMNITILDDGGNLKHFVRMDGAFLGSIEISRLKANTSASFPFSTKQVGEIVQTRVPGLAFVPGLVTFEGGLPIITGGGEQIGAVGVSGAKAEEDGMCAQAALDAVKDDLK
jgi:glc operon protein GlcG